MTGFSLVADRPQTMLVSAVTPFNAALFPEYVLPNVAHLIRDTEELVRCIYAQCIVPLADTALRYLEMGQALRAHGAFQRPSDAQEADEARYEVMLLPLLRTFMTLIYHNQVSYESALADLQNQIQDHLAALLMDPSSAVKRAVLHNISSLCIFLGVQSTNDVLLSHMITYLNDRDWLLRLAFFESIVDVAACAGGRSLEEYILPLMVQALSGMMDLGWTSSSITDGDRGRCRRDSRCTGPGVSDEPM
jgi:phosphoinositide-3-kinase regulatory subunit 4